MEKRRHIKRNKVFICEVFELVSLLMLGRAARSVFRNGPCLFKNINRICPWGMDRKKWKYYIAMLAVATLLFFLYLLLIKGIQKSL